MKKLSQKQAQEMVENWNEFFPVGTPVRYWSVLPGGKSLDTKTRSEAWIQSSGHPVVMIERQSGSVSLQHVVAAEDLEPGASEWIEGLRRDESGEPIELVR